MNALRLSVAKMLLVSKVSMLCLATLALLVLLSVIIGMTCEAITHMNTIQHVIGLDVIGLLAAVYIVDWIKP